MAQIDKVDLQILDLLQENGRISQHDLAKAVGLSAPAVGERLRKLEEREIIRQFTAVLDPRRLGTAPRGGGTQLTYAGWPLFYYVRDRGPGDTTGQHITDAWGTWHPLAPSGQPIWPAGGGY